MIVKDQKSLSIITKGSILDVVEVLNPILAVW